MTNVVPLRTRAGFIEVQDCDLELEQALRDAYAINGPVCSLIAEFRERCAGDALATVYALASKADENAEALLTAIKLSAFRGASADTHPKGGDSVKHEAPFMSGVVPEGQTPVPCSPSKDHSNG